MGQIIAEIGSPAEFIALNMGSEATNSFDLHVGVANSQWDENEFQQGTNQRLAPALNLDRRTNSWPATGQKKS